MITTFQLNNDEIKEMTPLIDKFNAIVYNNENQPNSFLRLKDMLDINVDSYRFHLQNSVTLSHGLYDYMKKLIPFMERNFINLLSLSVEPMKSINMEYFLGMRVADNSRRRFYHLNNVGVIYSKKFVNLMKDHIVTSSQTIDDIEFMNEIFRKTNSLRHIHLPTLVQSNLHPVNNLFDKNFLINKNE